MYFKGHVDRNKKVIKYDISLYDFILDKNIGLRYRHDPSSLVVFDYGSAKSATLSKLKFNSKL